MLAKNSGKMVTTSKIMVLGAGAQELGKSPAL
jgi:hypothetical protein